MIELKHINKSFGNKAVLRDVSFQVEDGETLALIGGSGSGKSTLLRLMIGLDRPTSGEIWIDGREITGLTEEALPDFS